jgi:hypothetical protein
MSFAGPPDSLLRVALQKAYNKGIVLVAAAGNAGPDSEPLYPGAYPGVIAVTATDNRDQLFPGSNRGTYIAVAAPGVDVFAPAPDGAYQLTTGTSFLLRLHGRRPGRRVLPPRRHRRDVAVVVRRQGQLHGRPGTTRSWARSGRRGPREIAPPADRLTSS